MTPFTKQKFLDLDCHNSEGILPGFDFSPWSIVQLKYDGHWCRLEFDSQGHGIGYTTSNRVETTVDAPDLANCVFIGEHIFGTNWAETHNKGSLVLFDCLVEDGQDVSHKPYSARFNILGYKVYNSNHPRLFTVHTRPIELVSSIWTKFVLGAPGFEGIVLRNWNQPYETELHRTKKDVENTYRCIGFVEGEGKHTGRLGALVLGNPETGAPIMTTSNKPATCGGRISDDERQYIWDHKEEFLNRDFDATGKGLFDSGALRHPNFVRWK